jgi:hypothetical protein
MAELTAYQKRKEIEGIFNSLDKGQKKQLLELLLEDWAETLPQKGKEQGVTGVGGKWSKRLEWLQEHWGTQFPTKGTMALRKMPVSGVIELLTLYALSTADQKDDLDFGSFEMGTDLTNKVNTALSALKESSGEQVTISRNAFNELQRIKREFAEAGGEVRNVDSSILSSLGELLKSLPSVKSEKEVAKYEATKARRVKKEEMPAGFSE